MTDGRRRRGAKKRAAPRRRQRLDVDERRAQLVELGLAEFGSRTYDEVSIELIAKAAGISKGLLYHYFPTKRAFYVACVRAAATRLLDRLLEPPVDSSPPEQLSRALDAYLAYVRGHGRAFSTLLRSGVGADREIALIIDETRAVLLVRLTRRLIDIYPSDLIASPLVDVALHGWIGLAESMSVAWVEASVADETSAPTAIEVRTLLANVLVATVESAAGMVRGNRGKAPDTPPPRRRQRQGDGD